MKKILISVLLLVIITSVVFVASCSKDVGSEVGTWHGQMSIMDPSDDEYQNMQAMMMYGSGKADIYVTFDHDGSFYYEINLDAVINALKNSLGGFGGLFGIGDISGLVANMFDGMIPAGLTEFDGTYTINEDGLIIVDVDHEDLDRLYFKQSGNKLIQIEEDGEEIMVLKKYRKR